MQNSTAFPTTSASLVSGQRRGRDGDCAPSKWARKAAKLKEFEKEQWPPSEKACKVGRY